MRENDPPALVGISLERQRLYALRRQLLNPNLPPELRCELTAQKLTELFSLDPLAEPTPTH